MDLALTEPGQLLRLARLVLADAREMSYSIAADGAVNVARFAALDRTAVREQPVLASDNVSYFADVEKTLTPGKIGVVFRVRDVPPPKADEVQVDVYAAALNFRDVMVAMSLRECARLGSICDLRQLGFGAWPRGFLPTSTHVSFPSY